MKPHTSNHYFMCVVMAVGVRQQKMWKERSTTTNAASPFGSGGGQWVAVVDEIDGASHGLAAVGWAQT